MRISQTQLQWAVITSINSDIKLIMADIDFVPIFFILFFFGLILVGRTLRSGTKYIPIECKLHKWDEVIITLSNGESDGIRHVCKVCGMQAGNSTSQNGNYDF